MSKDFFSQIAERRADAIAELDAKTFAPLIRNHLVQLFRLAHAKDKGLTGVTVGMGVATGSGEYLKAYEDGETIPTRCHNYHPDDNCQPKHPETAAFLRAVHDYSDRLCNGLAYINDITPADLEPRRVKKARVWGPHGLRARMDSNPGQIPAWDTMANR